MKPLPLFLPLRTLLRGTSPKARHRNLDGSGSGSFLSALRWMIVDTLAGRRRRSPSTAPVRRVNPDPALLATSPQAGAGARLTWIGHAGWLIQLEGKSFLVDPVFGNLPGFGPARNIPTGIPPGELPPIDAVLITHSHYDHLDLPTLKQVGAPLIAGLGLKGFFAQRGMPAQELGWWQTLDLGPVRITFVPSQHWSRRGLWDANETLWGGFILQGGGVCLYHSGDSAYFKGFSEIGLRFPAIDAALLPIGAYDPGWFMERSHMNPEQAVQAFLDLGARRFYPMHWGTFKLSDEPLDEPPLRLQAEWTRRGLPEPALGVLAVGESVEVP